MSGWLPALGLALRALRARRGVSLAVVVVAVFVVAAATAGPVYLRAAGESVLQDALAEAGPVSTGLTATLGGSRQGDPDRTLRAATAAGLEGTERYEPPVHGLEAPVPLPAVGPSVVLSRLVLRDGACAHLVLDGACPAAAGEVAVSVNAAERLGVRRGSALRSVGGLALRVSALYRLPDPDAVYWAGRSFTGPPGRLDPPGVNELVDVLFTAPPTMALLTPDAPVTATTDVQARVSRLRLAEAGAVESEAQAVLARLQAQAPDAVVATGLPQLLDRVSPAPTCCARPCCSSSCSCWCCRGSCCSAWWPAASTPAGPRSPWPSCAGCPSGPPPASACSSRCCCCWSRCRRACWPGCSRCGRSPGPSSPRTRR